MLLGVKKKSIFVDKEGQEDEDDDDDGYLKSNDNPLDNMF